MNATICAICIILLVAWLRDHRRDQQRRKRWELRSGMSLEDELEVRCRVLDRDDD